MDVASNNIEGLKLIGEHYLLSVDRVITFERFFYLENALQADHSTLLYVSLSEPRHKSGTIRSRYEAICFAVCSVSLAGLVAEIYASTCLLYQGIARATARSFLTSDSYVIFSFFM
ncbi:MAG: hypothetical protein DIZ78_12195 [endosymbiont of Escarpia spicata]|uniref:Uncharacterized protein n=1 Tax=endosymbiont of Escarpia spicata TaxID=2200908 RepID=A0A370DJV0_9GAMM|nr:MAG: hypothetical protein DIZ78_12195 [endosymbiont of Escarpia spicata]